MIKLSPAQLPDLLPWFLGGPPGMTALAEHALAPGAGDWWADRAVAPRTVAVACAGHLLLRGDPTALPPLALAPFAAHHVQAPARFLPLLSSAFDLLVPWERMTYVHRVSVPSPRPPHGVTVRRLALGDETALAALGPESTWIQASWGSPSGLASSGHGWAAFAKDRVLAVACTYFRGTTYEDVACVTVPDHRRQRLALACVTALCQDIAARGHTPSWTCSRDNRPSRLAAWTAGFRLEHEHVHYLTGQPARHVAGLTV
ncbi:GNAT family N-acetyltransferase [Streptomyces caniferus]|uniref:GNAT family N-acetyltransferase n=1 Tax=Streptomyces caniferus TaxID=285557 RepID=UPI002E2BB365|nr:GNAT family N-acetyltransferase [Streptomyces caniferus]